MAQFNMLRSNFLSFKKCSITFVRTKLEHNRAMIPATSEDEFRTLVIYPRRPARDEKKKSRFHDAQVLPPRETRMPIDQDWPSVWPTAKTFRPSVVPLPLYQGYDQKRAPPGKYANTELIKIPNFLHLTPKAIKNHCAAIKKFCSPFPEALKSDIDCDKHFPVQVITSDYCHSSPTIRDERSRIVTLKVQLSALKLDYHGDDKIRRLVAGHAHMEDNVLTLVADRCPLRKQNYDYLVYLLTALHHESMVTKQWEGEKTEADMERFFFENSRIQKKIANTIKQVKYSSDSDVDEEKLKKSDEVENFGKVVSALINEGEIDTNVANYKTSVLKSLNLS